MKTSAAILLMACCLALFSSACDQPNDDQDGENSRLVWSDCVLEPPRFPLQVEAQCTTLPVAENPAAPDGPQIALRLARVAARTREPAPDPILFLAGGPGQAATEAFPLLARAFGPLRAERDIILMDQRGTGGSNALRCPPADDETIWEVDLDTARQAARECLAALPGDPRYYTTTIAAGDIERLRQALGVPQFNLIGVSYGTRLAQTYLKYHPDGVRTLVLDGVMPQDLPLGLDHSANLDRALEVIFAACRNDAACTGAFGDPAADLAKLREISGEQRPTVEMVQPRSGEVMAAPLNPEVLAAAIRFLSYAPETQALLPQLLHQGAEQQIYDGLVSQAVLTLDQLMESLAHGMELSVVCSEDAPRYPASRPSEGGLLGGRFVDYILAQCEVWPRGQRPHDFHEPARSDVPVLLLSGERDPVTPPAFGERAAGHFPNALHLVAAGQAHGVLGRGCIPRIVAAFVASAGGEELDTGCMNQLGPTPFFTTLLGPEP